MKYRVRQPASLLKGKLQSYQKCRFWLPEVVALLGGDLEKSRVAKHGTHLLTLGAMQLGEKSKPFNGSTELS